jgi:NhaP-type Na+/H+ or K+/H+ antiporter
MQKAHGTAQGRLVPVLIWAVFALGLLAQAFSVRLQIKDDAFVVPPALLSEGEHLDLARLVARERQLQWFSLVATMSGALGLAWYYRRSLFSSQRSS